MSRASGLIRDAILVILQKPTTVREIQEQLALRDLVASPTTISHNLKVLCADNRVRIVGNVRRRQVYQLSAEAAVARQKELDSISVRPFRPLTFFPRPPHRSGGWNAERMPRSFLLEDLKCEQ